jgi:hypothetical protein
MNESIDQSFREMLAFEAKTGRLSMIRSNFQFISIALWQNLRKSTQTFLRDRFSISSDSVLRILYSVVSMRGKQADFLKEKKGKEATAEL